MSTARAKSVPAVLGLLPWVPIVALAAAAPLMRLANLYGIAQLVSLISVIWIVIWAIRNAAKWLQMLRLALAGTPAEMLSAGALMLESWPTLVDVCGWVPRTAMGHKPALAMKLWGIVSGNATTLGPRIVRIESAPAGPVAIVALTPRITADHIAAHANRIADMWGAESVLVTRNRPNEVEILARVRDPLQGGRNAFSDAPPSQQPPVSADDFLQPNSETEK